MRITKANVTTMPTFKRSKSMITAALVVQVFVQDV